MENELKPCPFCGGADAFVETKDTIVGKRLRAICPNCMASVDTGWFQKNRMLYRLGIGVLKESPEDG